MNRIFHFALVIGFSFLAIACATDINKSKKVQELNNNPVSFTEDSIQINFMLDSFNLAAAQANFEAYFAFFADDATFLGTDATENWNKKDFMIWAKPFFDRGNAWSFTSIDRHVYFHPAGEIAWFDELLDTQMKICRGSGVLVKQGNDWKIQQYVLSMTIPNSHTNEVVRIKSLIEDSLIHQLSGRTD
jgi:hypothetical protein